VSEERKGKGLQLRTIYLVVYVCIIILAAAVLLPDYWYLFLIVVVIALVRIAFYFVPGKKYRCNKCGAAFSPGRRSSSRPSPNEIYQEKGKIYCPKCGSTDVVTVKKGSSK
jgi:DNA-directed RNA polymerase subunit RPC12/RpoP